MLKLHHIPNTRSLRVRWLLEELGLEYELELVKFSPEALRAPEHLRISPLGKVPALEDGDIHMMESGAIIEYILRKYGDGRLVPAEDTNEWATYLQWLHGAETLAQGVAVYFWNSARVPEDLRSEPITELAKERALLGLAGLEAELEGNTFICGDTFTAADIMIGYALLFASFFELIDENKMPNAAAYFERLKARDAYQRATAD